MTKEEIKTVCEADPQMMFWAMVLFAEVSVLVDTVRNQQYSPKEVWNIIESKVREFDRILLARTVEQAKGGLDKLSSLESRVKDLERAMVVIVAGPQWRERLEEEES